MSTPNPSDRHFRIALMHGLRDSIEPTLSAFARNWPEASTFNLLDDSLSEAVRAEGRLGDAVIERVVQLARYAAAARCGPMRTDAILFTGSAFRPAVSAARETIGIPVLHPTEAALMEALRTARPVAVLVTFAPSLEPLLEEARELGSLLGADSPVRGVLVEGALAALQAGNADEHDQRIAASVACLDPAEVVVLGQFSMARARQAVNECRRASVLTTPDSAIAQLRAQLGATSAAGIR